MTSGVKLALVGCGGISRAHVKGYADLYARGCRDFEVVACCDASEDALARFQAAKLHYLARHRLPRRRPVIIWGAGPTGRLTHDLLAVEGVAVAGFLEVHPRRIGGQKRGRPVWPVERLEREPSAFVLAAVGSAGARPRIRAFMERLGRDEGEDYLFVA